MSDSQSVTEEKAGGNVMEIEKQKGVGSLKKNKLSLQEISLQCSKKTAARTQITNTEIVLDGKTAKSLAALLRTHVNQE